MPINKIDGVVVETPLLDEDQFLRTGVMRDDQFAVCDQSDRSKQIQFETKDQNTNVKTVLRAGAASSDVVITLPTTSGTLGYGGDGDLKADGTVPLNGTWYTGDQTIVMGVGQQGSVPLLQLRGSFDLNNVLEVYDSGGGLVTYIGNEGTVFVSYGITASTVDAGTVNASGALDSVQTRVRSPDSLGWTALMRVNGSQYNLLLPGSQGAANTYLRNDGAGNLSWEALTTGSATLVAGTVTIPTAAITASSRVFVSVNGPAGVLGTVYEAKASRIPGTSFVIASTSVLDTSEVVWMIKEPN